MKENEIISCKIASKLISIGLERRLTFKEKTLLAAHLLICKTCGYFKNEVTLLRKLILKYPQVVLQYKPYSHQSLDSEAKNRIKQAISKAIN